MPRYMGASDSETGKNSGSSWECKGLLICDLGTSGFLQLPGPALTGTNISSVQICYTPPIANSSFSEWVLHKKMQSTHKLQYLQYKKEHSRGRSNHRICQGLIRTLEDIQFCLRYLSKLELYILFNVCEIH